jgi:hypothetical protein
MAWSAIFLVESTTLALQGVKTQKGCIHVQKYIYLYEKELTN